VANKQDVISQAFSLGTYKGKELEMKVFVMKQFGIVIAVVSLAIVWNLGIATAQTAEEGIANFYSDKFQGRKTASGAVYDKNKLTARTKRSHTEPRSG